MTQGPTPFELTELFIHGFKLLVGETLSKLKDDIKSERNGLHFSPVEPDLLGFLDIPNVFSFIRDKPGKDVVMTWCPPGIYEVIMQNKIIKHASTGSWWRWWQKDESLGFKAYRGSCDLLKMLNRLKEEEDEK